VLLGTPSAAPPGGLSSFTLGIPLGMSRFITNITFALAAFSVVAGVFLESLLSLFLVFLPSTTELRWTLIVGMPIVLLLSLVRLNQQPATTVFAAAMQSIAQLALFLAPYIWVASHAL
jgi:hypothetical protein